MKYFIALTSPNNELDALRQAEVLINDGHSLPRIFFLKNSVLLAYNTRHLRKWQQLSDKGIELAVCAAAAERRKLSGAHSCFSSGGLGLYAESLIDCDEALHFG